MRALLLGALTAALVSVPAFGKDPGQSWTEWRAMRRCAQHRPVSCIHRAALHRRVSYGWLRSVAWCESRFNPYATNGQYAGLFQFGPDAWNRTPYAFRWRMSAKWSALAAAYAFQHGRSSEWECA